MDNATKVKVLMLGESGVGKTSLLVRFVEDKFNNNFLTTLGVEYKQKQIEVNKTQVIVQVWDTAGNPIKLLGGRNDSKQSLLFTTDPSKESS